MRHDLGQAAHLGQTSQAKLLPLRGLLQLRRWHLIQAQLLLQADGWVVLRLTKRLAEGTVTDKDANAENIRHHSLIVRLSEHKGDKFANRCEDHHDVIGSFRLICETVIV